DEASIEEAVSLVASKVPEDCLWGLVNNAGICISAPLECVSSDVLRQQLEVNLVGQLAVCRAFLPLLRAGGEARIVNITSGLGTVAIPYLGAYSAAQFAKEAMSDALRRELRPLGVTVSVVAPGAIWTPIWGKIAKQGKEIIDAAPKAVSELYRDTYQRFLAANEEEARKSKTTPEHVADAVCEAMLSGHPKPRYRVGADVRRGSLLARILPDEALDAMLSSIVAPVPGAKEDTHV
ncbi:MAG: SDR family NAD(P)-dependent oxidoreductase, partial [Myxococcota bacterium]